MPRTKPLTQKQARDDELQRISNSVLNLLGEKRGRENKTYLEFANEMGLTREQYLRWRNNGIGPARMDRVFACVFNAGYTFELVPLGGKHNVNRGKQA